MMAAAGERAPSPSGSKFEVSTPRRTILTYCLLSLSLVLPLVFLYGAMGTFRELMEMQQAHRRRMAATASALLALAPLETGSAATVGGSVEVFVYDSALPAGHADAEIVNRILAGQLADYTTETDTSIRTFVALPPRTASGRIRVARLDLSRELAEYQPAGLTGYLAAAFLAALGSLGTLAAYLMLARQSARLQQLAQVGMMSASLAHEIRNPLGTIKGFAELCRKKAEPGSVRYLDTILREAGRLEKLVEDLLAYARPRNPSYQVLLWDSLAPRLRVPDRQGLDRVRVAPAHSLAMDTDRDILLQILLNLIRNGLEAAERGEVAVSAWSEDSTVHIVVDDEGPGIPGDLRPRIFQPFFSSKPYGTGLGLPIALRLTERLGGRLSLVRRNQGGTRARLTLTDAVATDERKNREDTGH